MTEAVESQTGLVDPRKVVYFALGGTDDWVQSKPSSRPAERIPAAVRNSVDVDEYFREGLFTRRTQAGSFNLVEVKFAPNFIIPRHHHNFDQLVLVVEGSARQGKRWFHVGDGYFTKANTPYVTAAGPEGCRIVEIRKDPIEDLEAWWDEDRPERWLRERWENPTPAAEFKDIK